MEKSSRATTMVVAAGIVPDLPCSYWMTPKAEEILYFWLQFCRGALPGDDKAIAVNVGPEKPGKLTDASATFASYPLRSSAKFCNNLVHFEIIFMVNYTVRW